VIKSIRLPTRRSFSWRALWILVALQLLGNLLSIPTIIASNLPIEPLLNWVLLTALSIPIIAIALFLGGKIGLGAPLIEGYLHGQERRRWARTVVALSVLVAVAATPLILLLNQNVAPEGYPAIWKLALASVDAGVQEEIFSRLLLMTGLAWLGSLAWHEEDGRPIEAVLWTAILISGILFGWAHVDDKLSIPGVSLSDYLILMLVSSIYGIVFGWLYWKLGIECAILAHFAIDALATGIIVPVYISQDLIVQLVALVGLLLAGGISWIVLKQTPVDRP
jgi:membrane protease YdiL (CAAX protease family)